MESRTQTCSWGDVCPTGMYCDDAFHRCLFPGQVEACEGLGHGEVCWFPNAPEGDWGCSDGLCTLSFCGDGLVGPLEMCDDGGHEDGDGCSADCLSDETCGNGYRDAPNGEGCDDGNRVSHDGCTSGCTSEYPAWRLQSSHLPPRFGCDAVFDESRGVLVMFGGMTGSSEVYADTWEFDGIHWRSAVGNVAPEPRMDHSLAYDADRQRVVVHAGWTGLSALQDTWEFDGVEWSEIVTNGSPPLRSAQGMVYDASRGRIVLFGGEDAARNCFDDTWEYDGVTWTLIQPPESPPGRRYPDLVYDPVRERVVLFGGSTGTSTWTFLDDTWEYNGTTWTPVSTAAAPPPRHGHRMVWDTAAQRVVLYGGAISGSPWTFYDDTWEYDGATWTPLTLAAAPPGRMQFSMGYDSVREQLLVQGGTEDNYVSWDDTWALADGVWTPRPLHTPEARLSAAMAYHDALGHVLLFGGATDYSEPAYVPGTWTYDGAVWKEIPTSPSPSLRFLHAMAYDPERLVVVLFGGYSGAFTLADTWEWTGALWEQRSPDVSPSARLGHAMTYDAARGQIVLHGGANQQTYYDETWLYDGATWALSGSPGPARSTHCMVYDERRDRVVLFGGEHGGGALDETWEWDGSVWTQVLPATTPNARNFCGMIYHRARGTVVMLGGVGYPGIHSDTWEYDGVNWAPVSAAGDPWERLGMGVAYHAIERSVVMFGGKELMEIADPDTWVFRYEGAWPDEACDNGIDDDADELVDCQDHDCDYHPCGPGRHCLNGACL